MSASSERVDWVKAFIRRGRVRGTVPRYGSLLWCRLPEDDPRKVAAVCIAAECWAIECDPQTIREQLENELSAQRWLEDQASEVEHQRVAAQVIAINRWVEREKPWADRPNGGRPPGIEPAPWRATS
jgi:hypothetical protein